MPKSIPDGYHSVTPYLVTDDAKGVIDFVEKTFDAEVVDRMDGANGTIMHATVRIGDSLIMLSDANPKWPAMPAMLYVYVDDVDSIYRRAVQAGGVSLREPTDEFYGDRSGGVRDHAGNQWWIATHVEDVPHEEMARRQQDWMDRQQPGV